MMIWRGQPTVCFSTTTFPVAAMFRGATMQARLANLANPEISTLVGRLDLHQARYLANVHT